MMGRDIIIHLLKLLKTSHCLTLKTSCDGIMADPGCLGKMQVCKTGEGTEHLTSELGLLWKGIHTKSQSPCRLLYASLIASSL